MEIAQSWHMLPTEVYELYFNDPINYTFMRAKILADFEWQIGNDDIAKPDEDLDLTEVFERL